MPATPTSFSVVVVETRLSGEIPFLLSFNLEGSRSLYSPLEAGLLLSLPTISTFFSSLLQAAILSSISVVSQPMGCIGMMVARSGTSFLISSQATR